MFFLFFFILVMFLFFSILSEYFSNNILRFVLQIQCTYTFMIRIFIFRFYNKNIIISKKNIKYILYVKYLYMNTNNLSIRDQLFIFLITNNEIIT